jgi:putative ABC transport system substrate-binding protein
VEAAVRTASHEGVAALYTLLGLATNRGSSLVAQLALLHRLPTMGENRGFVAAGGLLYYGPSVSESFRRAAYYVDRILKGTKPADLPIEQPMTFDFVVNMRTARELGITFPHEILLQITEVIE